MAKPVVFNRDALLRDLKENVIEVCFDNKEPRILRCTLMTEFLPTDYKESADDNFHATHPTILAVWNLDTHRLCAFEIGSVRMVQALDPLLFRS